MLQLCSVVIFDKFCSFSVQVLLVVLYTELLICNKSDRYIQFFGFVVWGWVPGRWRSPLHYLGYTLEWSLVFGVCAGGGG